MDKRKVPSDKEALKSRGMRAGKGGNPGKPESQPMPKPHELKKG